MTQRRPSGRITVRGLPSETGLDDFDEELTHAGLEEREPDEDTLDDPHGLLAAASPFPPGIEVAIVQEHGMAQRPGQWRCFEIWTRSSVYAIDGSLVCFGVMDRTSGLADPKHKFLGARLMGGEKRGETEMQFAHPLPTPGFEAVFQIASATKGKYGHTSPVEKVVVRLRLTIASLESSSSMWDEVTTTFRRPGE